MKSMRILDPEVMDELIHFRKKRGIDRKDEVWDGVYVIMPDPTIEHQRLVKRLTSILIRVVDDERRGETFPGTNVSDRRRGWEKNFRAPDVVVVLAGGRAQDCNTHWLGGPDLLVEIESPGDETDAKIPFYGDIGVRELLVIHRDSRQLRLYRNDGTSLAPVEPRESRGKSWFVGEVVPLAFSRIAISKQRPRIVVRRTDGSPDRWTI
jgi:Uma2 family endonuclease